MKSAFRQTVPSLALICAAFLFATVFTATALAADGPDRAGWPTHLRFLTGPAGGQWFTMGDPIAEALSRNVLPATSRIGGGVANISDVSARAGDMGFTLACFLGAAGSGEKEYEDIDLSNAELMVQVYPQVLYFLMREDFAKANKIDSVEALLKADRPIRFASLKPGTASEFIVSLLLKYGYDTSFDKLRDKGWSISFNNYAETADNFVAGDLDCFAYTAGTLVPLIKTMEEHTAVTVLPVDARVLDLLSEKFKTSTYTIEPGIYKSVTSPIATLGDYTCIVVRKDLPESLVYAINKTLWENKAAIAAKVADFGGLAPATALPSGLAVHPGSAAFWKSIAGAK